MAKRKSGQKRRNDVGPPAPAGDQKRYLWVVLGIVVVGGGFVLFSGRPSRSRSSSPDDEPVTVTQRVRSKPTPQVQVSATPVVVTSSSARVNYAEAPASAEPVGRTFDSVEGMTVAQQRLIRAQRTLEDYLENTKYPFTSQSISKHPDMAVPNNVMPARLPLARPDQKKTDAHVNVSQDRLFMQGDEVVALRVRCENGEGPQPCEFAGSARAYVREGLRGADKIKPSPVAFVVDGGDPSQMVGVFSPAKQGFAAYEGAIVIEGQLKVGGEEGGVSWQVTYTPQPPAVFTKKFREVIENGSLSIYVGMQVNKAGRYVVTARGASKDGKTFAYMQFNDELPAGAVEAKIQIFGKLVHDEKAVAPFKIRDVEGFLLRDGGYPDRELMGIMAGEVFTTQDYPLASFSNDVWNGDEKQRHVDHFNEEVQNAQDAVNQENQGGGHAAP